MGPEAKIERAICDYARSKGCLVYKFTSPANRSVPDRLFVPKDKPPFFVEFKAPKGKLTKGQEREIERLIAQGQTVLIVRDIEFGKEMIDAYA